MYSFASRGFIRKGLVVMAGLLALPDRAVPDPRTAAETRPGAGDERLSRIRDFFHRNDCPAKIYAFDFTAAADQHHLDWRLLPSISMVETTGGKVRRNNNMFGWDNGNVRFRSLREGIYHVAERLANASPYRDKDLDGILRAYNPRPEYRQRVKTVMAQFGPGQMEPLPAR
jgi:hypothetical protein